jgi:serine/threonine protein phosphatase PrpC
MPMNSESDAKIGHRALAVKAFGITDKGRVRPSNEDQFLSAELTKAMRIWQTSLPEPKAQFGMERGHLFLVADGMGGHRAGEHASALAVVAIEQFTLNTFKWFFDSNAPEAQRVLTEFQKALRQADARILEEATEHPEFGGMGTTVTMAFQLDDSCVSSMLGTAERTCMGMTSCISSRMITLSWRRWSAGERFGRMRSQGTASATSSLTWSEALKWACTSKLTR